MSAGCMLTYYHVECQDLEISTLFMSAYVNKPVLFLTYLQYPLRKGKLMV